MPGPGKRAPFPSLDVLAAPGAPLDRAPGLWPSRHAGDARPLPQVAAGVVLVVVLRLRVPEQHGWSSERAHVGAAANGDAGGADLLAT